MSTTGVCSQNDCSVENKKSKKRKLPETIADNVQGFVLAGHFYPTSMAGPPIKDTKAENVFCRSSVIRKLEPQLGQRTGR